METSESPADCHKNGCGWNHPDEEETQCFPKVSQAQTDVSQTLTPGTMGQKAEKEHYTHANHSYGFFPAKKRNDSPFRKHDTPNDEYDLYGRPDTAMTIAPDASPI